MESQHRVGLSSLLPCVINHLQLSSNCGAGKTDPVKPLPAPEQAIHRVRWGPDTTDGAEFLAYGGAAGFLVLTAL